ncbi:MAG: ATP-grasp domain-containing protein [Candidatus Heimdallarchaeota archaeon]
MRILVQEYSSSGGMVQDRPSTSLLTEGFGILRVLIQNCKRLGMEVVTTLDERLSSIANFLDADIIEFISKEDEFTEKGLEHLNNCDYFLVVAPGVYGILSSIINLYQKSKATSLNCNSSAIELSTNKDQTYEELSKNNIRIPNTLSIKPNSNVYEITNNGIVKNEHKKEELQNLDLTFPLVVKPNDGVDCEGVNLCKNKSELIEYVELNQKKHLLIQEYIIGDNLSITAFVNENKINILSVNEQLIRLGFEGSEYLGGVSNIRHPLDEKIRSFGEKVLRNIEGLNGFVGIDLIVSKNAKNVHEIYLIEINPRVTTSVCGLINQKNPPLNFLQVDSKFNHKKNNTCYFAKTKFNFPINVHLSFDDLISQHSIITPPLTFDKKNTYSLLRGFGRNAKMATNDYNQNLAFLTNKLKKDSLTNRN